MSELVKGSTYRCSRKECGVEVQVLQECRSQEDCQLSCCGERMQRK
jgi:predicted nucleic acid-binding Zn ribbon protein